MEQKCPICGEIKVLIPAGISKKTGEAYDAFYSCPNRCRKGQQGFQQIKKDFSGGNDNITDSACVEGLRQIWSKLDEILSEIKLGNNK